jgi:hypothetical protein
VVQLRLHDAQVLRVVQSNQLKVYYRAWLPLLLL